MNTKLDKQHIYEIFRACRLCGAGGGYKMPIIQNIINLDDSEIELREKIRECVNIEINQNDCMPPLICELCVDKVNDFYEFANMCKQTNRRTRLRLGLPLQTKPREATNTEDCILGVTEPVYIKDEGDEPLLNPKRGEDTATKSKKKAKSIKKEKKKIPEVNVKLESESLPQSARTTRGNSSKESKESTTDITPPRTSRSRSQVKFDVNNEPQKDTPKQNAVKSILKKDTQPQKRSPKQQGKAVSMKEVESEDTPLLLRSLKRCRGKEEHSSDASTKRVKVSTEISPQKKAQTEPKHVCLICDMDFKKSQSLANHLRAHTVTFTSVKLACNACCKWFANAEETAAHHRMHATKRKPYHCTKCITNFRNLPAYNSHFEENKCVPWTENPDVKCKKCPKTFPTENLRKKHRCNVKLGGECKKCMKSFANLKSLNEHKCIFKTREYMKIRKKLLPMQVRVSRCDPLLADSTKEHCHVSMVDINFGLDPNCVYPYFKSDVAIKKEPIDDFEGMVNIKDEIKHEFCHEDEFINWDSNVASDNEKSNVSSSRSSPNLMANLYKTDKEVFSKNSLDKVSKKRRKSQLEESDENEEDCPVFKGFSNTSDNDKKNDKDHQTGEYEENNVNAYNIDMKNDVTNDTESTASEETDTEKSTVNEIIEKSDTQRNEYKNQNNDQCNDIEKVNNDNKEIKTNCEIKDSNTNESEIIAKSDDFFNKNEEVSKNVEDSNMLNDVDSAKTDENNEKDDFPSDNTKDCAEIDAQISQILKDSLGVDTDIDNQNKEFFNSNKFECNENDDCVDKESQKEGIYENTQKNEDPLLNGESFTDYLNSKKIDNSFEESQNEENLDSDLIGCNENDYTRKDSKKIDNLVEESKKEERLDSDMIGCNKNDDTREDSKKIDESQNEARLDSVTIGCNKNYDTREELEVNCNENNENVQKIDESSKDVNGQSIDNDLEPVSDAETVEDNLMAELDKQIGITKTEDKNCQEKIEIEKRKLMFDDDKSCMDEILKSEIDATELDDVSDDDFDFDDEQ